MSIKNNIRQINYSNDNQKSKCVLKRALILRINKKKIINNKKQNFIINNKNIKLFIKK